VDSNERFLASIAKYKKITDNLDVLLTKTDKGNVTVAVDVLDTNKKMRGLLSDSNTYEVVKKGPTIRLTNEVRSLLGNWLKKDYIDIHMYRKMLITDGLLPRAYGLPKIYKDRYPLRIIVSSLKSLFYELACFLHNIIKNSIP